MQVQADKALAERCRAGVPGAFEELYRAHAPRLFGLACRLVGRGEAEDALQDIFLTAYRKLDLYRGDASLGTWLYRVGANVCVDRLRGRKARAVQFTETLDEQAAPLPAGAAAGPILSVVDRLDLEQALGNLPAGARTVFVLHDVEGLEHREIAGMLEISQGTSKSQLHKARVRLRAALGRRAP